jgi:hypothetical protein
MEKPLQHQTTPYCSGLSPACAGGHRTDGPKGNHALTLNLDHSSGAVHAITFGTPASFYLPSRRSPPPMKPTRPRCARRLLRRCAVQMPIWGSPDWHRTPGAAANNISVDYAIMEKADNLAVMPFGAGWSDLGFTRLAPDAWGGG